MPRAGTSLVEVLVASVLLAIGVSGALSTLAIAARFRERASAREELSTVALDQLGWFVAHGCAVADSLRDSLATSRLSAAWSVTRDSSRARFAIALTRRAPFVDEALSLNTEHPC